jgi:hypothetical protein
MNRPSRTFAIAAPLILFCAVGLRAETAADPSGHWKGTLQGPTGKLEVEFDLVKRTNGAVEGTVTIPSQNVNAIPLRPVVVRGRLLTFGSRADQNFVGTLSDDNRTIVGDYKGTGPLGNEFAIPFTLERTGAAKIAAMATNPAVSKQLVGTWNGTLEVKSTGRTMRLVLTLENHKNGTSTGHLKSLDEGGFELPVSVVQKASTVSLDFKAVGASYTGKVNAAGTELVGTYSQGPNSLPLTFHHAPMTNGTK